MKNLSKYGASWSWENTTTFTISQIKEGEMHIVFNGIRMSKQKTLIHANKLKLPCRSQPQND